MDEQNRDLHAGHERLWMRFSLSLLCVVQLSMLSTPSILGQTDSAQPFTFSVKVVDLMNQARDATEKLDSLNGAIVQYKHGKQIQFGTVYGKYAEKFHEAADAIDKAPVITDIPAYQMSQDREKKSARDNLKQYVFELRSAEKVGIDTRSKIDSDIALSEKKRLLAERLTKLYGHAAALNESAYAADYVDAMELENEITSYESSLKRLRGAVDRGIKDLRTRIANGEANLRDPIVSDMLSNIRTANEVRTEQLKSSEEKIQKNNASIEHGNSYNSEFGVKDAHSPHPPTPPNPYSRPGSGNMPSGATTPYVPYPGVGGSGSSNSRGQGPCPSEPCLVTSPHPK